MESLERYREILDVPLGATQDEIRTAYLRLTHVWHPDRFAHNPVLRQRAQEMMQEINKAYEALRRDPLPGVEYVPGASNAKEQRQSRKSRSGASHSDVWDAVLDLQHQPAWWQHPWVRIVGIVTAIVLAVLVLMAK